MTQISFLLLIVAVGAIAFLILLHFSAVASKRRFERENKDALQRIADELSRERNASRESFRENREELAKSAALQTETLAGTLTHQFSLLNESVGRSRAEQTQSLEKIPFGLCGKKTPRSWTKCAEL